MLPENRCPPIPLLTRLVGSAAAWAVGAGETTRQGLVATAVALCGRFEASADACTERGAAPVARGADAEDTFDAGAIPSREGKA